jgi:hypothetical protein
LGARVCGASSPFRFSYGVLVMEESVVSNEAYDLGRTLLVCVEDKLPVTCGDVVAFGCGAVYVVQVAVTCHYVTNACI